MADTLIFMDIDQVAGESIAAEFEDLIEIEGLDWGVSVKTSDERNQGAKNQVKFDRVTVRKFYDLATGTMMTRAIQQARGKTDGAAFPDATFNYIEVVLDDAGNKIYTPVVDIVLTGCYIEKVDLAATNGKGMQLTESIEISYKHIKFSYHPQADTPDQRISAMDFEADTPDDAPEAAQ